MSSNHSRDNTECFGDLLSPSDHLSETCCVSVRPSFGDLLRLRQTIFRRLAASPPDHLSETYCLRQTIFRRLAASPCSHRFVCCLDHTTFTEFCFVPIRSEFRRLTLSLSANISNTCLVCLRPKKRRSVDF